MFILNVKDSQHIVDLQTSALADDQTYNNLVVYKVILIIKVSVVQTITSLIRSAPSSFSNFW